MTLRGVDTNALIYAHIASLPQHVVVRQFLLAQLADESTTLAVSPMILHEFIHVVTDRRRFEPALTMAEALALVRGYLNKSNVRCLPVDEACMVRACTELEQRQLGRRRIADTLFAATLLEHGAHELITCNPHDFAGFEHLTLIDPRCSTTPRET